MSVQRTPATDEWQLGSEAPAESPLEPWAPEPRPRDLSAGRLDRPLQVVTVEHAAWMAVLLWTVTTRFVDLSAVPLGPTEARHALFGYDLANRTQWASAAGYHPVWSGWLHLCQAGLFAAGGTNDFKARLIFAVAGLALIPLSLLLRRYLGRAGGIALGGLIAVSPTFTYFSRVNATGIVAAAMALGTLSAFMGLQRRPSFGRAIALGCMGGLTAATDPAGFVTIAIFVAALMLLGIGELVDRSNLGLRVRVWLERYAAMMVASIVAAALLWLASNVILLHFSATAQSILRLWTGIRMRQYPAGIRYYAPGMTLYEFLIAIAAVTGIIAVIALRGWSRVAVFSMLWTAMSFGCFLASPEREADRLILMLLPASTLAAVGLDQLHHTSAWPYARAVLLALGVATVYIQLTADFVFVASDAGEPPWSEHANLYWVDGTTPLRAKESLHQIRRLFPESGGTVFNFGEWQPALRWYLRDFRQASSARQADVVVNPNPPLVLGGDSEFENNYLINLQESWKPELTALTPSRLARFVATATPWGTLENKPVGLIARPRTDLAPTVIEAPALR